MLVREYIKIKLILWMKWAASRQNHKMACASSEDSDQPGHPPSLIRVFAVRMRKTWFLSYQLSAQRRLWSDWVDAQADLNVRWAHMPFCWFCHEAAQFFCRVHCIRLGTYLLQFRNRQFQPYHPCLHHNHQRRPPVRDPTLRVPPVRDPTLRVPCLLHNHTLLHNRPSFPCPSLPQDHARLPGNAFLYTFSDGLQNTYM